MKRSEQVQLLKEIFSGEELSNFRQASLERGLAVMQKQRRRRQAMRACSVIWLPLLIAMGIYFNRGHVAPSGKVAVSDPPPAPERASGVKIISDEELFALFPGRSMALVGKPGQQQLVFLDQSVRRDVHNESRSTAPN